MSSSWVREALPTSIRWSPPRRLSSHESTVPRHSSPRRLRARSGSWASSSQAAFSAENIGSSGQAAERAHALAGAVAAEPGAVRRRPLVLPAQQRSDRRGRRPRSHSTSDSRCVLSPTAATAAPSCPSRHRATAVRTLSQISVADCSTQPGCGCAWPTGADPRATICPVGVDEQRLRGARALVDREQHRLTRCARRPRPARRGDAVDVEPEVVEQVGGAAGGGELAADAEHPHRHRLVLDDERGDGGAEPAAERRLLGGDDRPGLARRVDDGLLVERVDERRC